MVSDCKNVIVGLKRSSMEEIVCFQDGSKIIAHCPHPAFEKITQHGHTIEYHIEEQKYGRRELVVKAVHGEQIVAEANFEDDGSDAWNQNVRTDKSYQRQGIANAMYVFAEKIFGKSLYNFWAGDDKQSPEARALWAQPNRPFGNHAKR